MPRPADRRAKIELLRAAEAVFVEHGLSAAKVEDITARAGVSKGAFYLHFEGKEDCFRQIVEAFLAKLVACIDTLPDTGPGMPVESFVAHLEAWRDHDHEILEFCWQNRGLMKMLFAGGAGAHFAYLVDEFSERTGEHMKGIARHLVAAGIYRADVDPEMVPTLVAGAWEGMVREIIKQPRRPDIEEWARQAQALFMRGLLTPAALAVVDRKVREQGPGSRSGLRSAEPSSAPSPGSGTGYRGGKKPPEARER